MIIQLIWEENTKDKDGFPKKEQHSVNAYAREKSANRSEVYEAMRAGVTVRMILEIRVEDWECTRHIVNGKAEYARKVKVDECEYRIIRGYRIGKATIELTCE